MLTVQEVINFAFLFLLSPGPLPTQPTCQSKQARLNEARSYRNPAGYRWMGREQAPEKIDGGGGADLLCVVVCLSCWFLPSCLFTFPTADFFANE